MAPVMLASKGPKDSKHTDYRIENVTLEYKHLATSTAFMIKISSQNSTKICTKIEIYGGNQFSGSRLC